MKNLIMILTCMFAGIGLSVAQTKHVSGTVLDDTGETAIGASVVAKGSTVGTVTDLDGKFSLDIPSDANTIVISLIGTKPKEVTAGTDLKIRLEADSKMIDEVVVTAMGISREKKALGYASQGISADKLNQAGNSDLTGAMQGKLSGVQITPSSGMPGASSQIVIRGARSFDGNNTPLYVVDGMPISSTPDVSTESGVTGTDFSNRAIDIDPSNIESIEILKGQAASALYGIRASNGVVIITTKSGKGLKKGKPQITINSTLSFDKVSRKLEFQKKYAQGSSGVYGPYNGLAWGPEISQLPNDPTYGGNTDNQYTQKYGHKEGMYYVPQRANAGLSPWASPRAYNNLSDFLEVGHTYTNSINVAQALDKSAYSLTFSSSNQDGIIPSTGMNRYTIGINASTQLTDQWSTGFSGSFVSSKIQKAPSANSSILATLYGAPASYDMKGIPSSVEANPYEQNSYRGNNFDNPYWAAKNNSFEERTTRFYGNGYVNYTTKLNSEDKKLNIKYQLGVDTYTTNYVDSWGYGSYTTANNQGQIEEYERKNLVFNSLLVSNFNWNINDDWNLNAILGNEFISERLDKLDTKGYLYNFAGWNSINNATSLITSSYNRSKRSVGFFGEVSASYRSMIYLGITGRNDMVSYMPRNNRSFFYPAFNASMIFTELEQLKEQKILTFGKIRASYAEVGQAGDYYDNYYYKQSFGGGFYSSTPIAYPIGGISGFSPYYTVFDPNLKPQNTRSYELGLDLTFLNGLFDFSYTYSRQNVKDQIFEIPLDAATGYQTLLTNGGKIQTDVHEISVNANPVKTKLIDWSIGFNFSKINNKVVDLAEGVESIFLGGFVTPQIRAQKGYSFPVIYGSDYLRDKQGRILVDSEGMPMAGETTVIGKVSPNFNLGFNTRIRIEKLMISAVFDWKSGGEMYHGTYSTMGYYGTRKDTENRDQSFVFNGYKSDGTKNDIAITPDKMQDYYNIMSNIDAASVLKSSFLKLRELSLTYPVYSKPWLNVSVNLFARNILVWTNMDYFDPESSQGNNNMAGGFERFSLPSTSSYGFGVNVKF